MPGYNDHQLRGLVRHLATIDQAFINRLKAAFRAKLFSYGTQGKGGGGLRLGAIMADSINQQVVLNPQGNPYFPPREPGVRVPDGEPAVRPACPECPDDGHVLRGRR